MLTCFSISPLLIHIQRGDLWCAVLVVEPYLACTVIDVLGIAYRIHLSQRPYLFIGKVKTVARVINDFFYDEIIVTLKFGSAGEINGPVISLCDLSCYQRSIGLSATVIDTVQCKADLVELNFISGNEFVVDIVPLLCYNE